VDPTSNFTIDEAYTTTEEESNNHDSSDSNISELEPANE
jgi:hypothetical protein